MNILWKNLVPGTEEDEQYPETAPGATMPTRSKVHPLKKKKRRRRRRKRLVWRLLWKNLVHKKKSIS